MPEPNVPADETPFGAIRAACAEVAQEARWVQLEPTRLADYARALPLAELHTPSYDRVHHFWGEADATLAYLVVLDAINFGSGYFPALVKRPGLSGYHTVALALKERFEAEGPWSAAALRAITPERCAQVFAQPPGEDEGARVRLELMTLFARALNDLGSFLAGFDDSFGALVGAAERSAARLLGLLTTMPFYQDVAPYRGRRVPFYKRAQITASDLSLAFGGRGYGTFDDLDELTIFADNLVPQVLRVDGLLEYHPELSARLEQGELLHPGEEAEVELRALALHAVERLNAVLRADGVNVCAQQLDVLLWNRGQAPRYRSPPRHRCRTVFY